jgi:hypothetical protein
MGRYYNGDIKGKFWFGVQDSTAPERFGCTEIEPASIEYYIDTDSQHIIVKELSFLSNKLGYDLQRFTDFFEAHTGYNDAMLIEAGLNPELLIYYADYILGKKILKCVEDNGSCQFTAEL